MNIQPFHTHLPGAGFEGPATTPPTKQLPLPWTSPGSGVCVRVRACMRVWDRFPIYRHVYSESSHCPITLLFKHLFYFVQVGVFEMSIKKLQLLVFPADIRRATH